MKQFFCCLFVSASLALSATVSAAPGDLVTRLDIVADSFALDDQNNVLYASLPESNSIAVINAGNPQLSAVIPVGSRPLGVALSRDRRFLYVATSGATRLEVVDLSSQSRLTPYSLPFSPGDVAVDARGRIYAVPVGSTRSMAIIHPDSGTVEQVSCNTCYSGMLEMSPDGNTMYLANQGLSPGTVEKLNVSGDGAPVSLWKNEHGSLGGNGQDLWLTPDGRHLYYAVGGGNGITGSYDIGQIDTTTLGINGALVTGPYPREITTSPGGTVVYAVHTRGHIDVWDAQTFLQITEYPTSGEASELITDSNDQFLFASFADGIRVYEGQGSEGLSDQDGDGIVDGSDNCQAVANPDQKDQDRDGEGDVCDLFPTESNNEFAQCALDLNSAENELQACSDLGSDQAEAIEQLEQSNAELNARVNELEGALTADADGDGVLDATDACPDTRSGSRTDANGCSSRQGGSGGWFWGLF